jgi:type IV pilus assembly protein PilO
MNLKNINLDQFKGLDPNDPGSWPVLVKAVAVIALCLAVLFAGYWFDTQHQWDDLEKVRKHEGELKQTFKNKQMKAINLDAYKKQMAEMERSFGAMLRQLPSKTEVAELLVDVSQAGLGNGLEFDLFKPRAEKPAEFYAELPIDVQVTGTYHEFGKFVSDVAALPRIVTLHDINITAKGDKLTMSTIAKTYRYLEDGK